MTQSGRLPSLELDVLADAAGDADERILTFVAALGTKRGLRVSSGPGIAHVSIDATAIERLGPRIEAAAVRHDLVLVIPDLDARIPSAGLDGAPSRVWVAIGRAVLDAELARERGDADPLEPFHYVRVDEIEGRRAVRVDLPELGPGSQPPDDDDMSEPAFVGGTTRYDDLDWHTGGAEAAGQPAANGFTHIGLYLAWVIRHGLHRRGAFPREHIAAVVAGEMTGSDLADHVDQKLLSDTLSPEGRAFTDHYYPRYLDAYAETFADQPDYGVDDTPAAYALIEPVLDRAFASWIEDGRPGPQPLDPDEVIDTPAYAIRPDVPTSMTRAELDAYMEAFVADVNVEMIPIDQLERPHVAPELEARITGAVGDAADDVSSVSATLWGSSLLNRALKRLGVRPKDVVVASAIVGDGPRSVMLSLYAVPGAPAAALESEFAAALHRPSSRAWSPRDVGGRAVQIAKNVEFIVIYWADDGLVFHLGASADVDLTDLVRRLSA